MPDLTASLDVELAREPGVLVVPRDAIRRDGDRRSSLQRGVIVSEQPVGSAR